MHLQFWSKLRQFFNTVPEAESEKSTGKTSPEDHLSAVLQPIEQARKDALNVDDGSLAEQRQQARKLAALEEERRLIEIHRQDLEFDTLALHETLATGLSRDELKSLSQLLKESVALLVPKKQDSLASHGVLAVAQSVHDSALAFGWQRLEEKLLEHSLVWPVPPGISPNATAEEIQQKTELHTAILEKDFLSYNLNLLADLICGLVPAWRTVYPERYSSVWTCTTYQAVAGAFAARRHIELVEKGNANLEAIRELLAQRLEPALAEVEQKLRQGVASRQEAEQLSDEACTICGKIAPEVFWEVVSPHT